MRLLKLNNSLGLEEQKWDLDWSNTSDKWTPELRAYVGASQIDDDDNTEFFIHLIDLCNKFTRTRFSRGINRCVKSGTNNF